MENVLAFGTAILTLIGSIVSIAKSSYGSISGFKSSKRHKLAKIIMEIKKLEAGSDFKQLITEKYEQQTILEITGINVSPLHYRVIQKNKVLKRYHESTIKKIARFFVFEKDDLKIQFGPKAHIAFRILIGTAIFFSLLLVFSCGLFISRVEENDFSSGTWISLLMAAVDLYFVASSLDNLEVYKLAKKIQNQLEQNHPIDNVK